MLSFPCQNGSDAFIMKDSHNILRDILAHKAGCSPIGYDAMTRVRLIKDNPYGLAACNKLTSGTGFNGAGYVSGIRRTLDKAGLPSNFASSSLPWGEWDSIHKVIIHKGCFYLRLYWSHADMIQNQVKLHGYFTPCGDSIDPKWIIRPNRSSRKQEHAGLDQPNQVVVRSYKFDSLTSVRIDGMTIDMTK